LYKIRFLSQTINASTHYPGLSAPPLFPSPPAERGRGGWGVRVRRSEAINIKMSILNEDKTV
jgi:hypothetical protein